MKEIPKLTPEQEVGIRRFEKERSERVKQVLIEWEQKKKLKLQKPKK